MPRRPPDRSSVVRYRRVELLRSAHRHGVDARDIDHALVHALVVEEVGEDPTRYLVLGPDRAGNLLELVVLDRPGGPAVMHAMVMRARYRRLLPGREPMTATAHGQTTGDDPVPGAAIDAAVESMADEAERGFDVDALLARRRPGRPSMGTSAAAVESVRLDPELRRDLLLRAAAEQTSVSEVIRTAVRRHLRAS